jgi:hypothetical protein
MSPDKRKSPKKPVKRPAGKQTRRLTKPKVSAKSNRLTSVSDLEESRARLWWLGLQAPDEQIDASHYAAAFAACMSLAGALDDDRAVELQIDIALDNGLKSTAKVQRMQEALAVYFKAKYEGKENQLRRALEIELSDGSNPITPIGIWAYLQRDYVANGKLTSKEAKVLEDTLVIACLPKDGKIGRVSSAVVLLRTGNLDGAPSQSSGGGGGCALPAATMAVLLLVLAAI